MSSAPQMAVSSAPGKGTTSRLSLSGSMSMANGMGILSEANGPPNIGPIATTLSGMFAVPLKLSLHVLAPQ